MTSFFIEENEENLSGNSEDYSELQNKISILSYGEDIVRKTLSIFPEEIASTFSSGDTNKIVSKEELSVDELFPDGLLSYSENLRELLHLYYRHQVATNDNIKSGSSIIQNLYKERDIDLSSPESLIKFFFELASDFSSTSSIKFNKKDLLKYAGKLYAQKGTPESFKNYIKLISGDFETEVRTPFENALMSSNGQWTQESFITVSIETCYGWNKEIPIDENHAFSFVFIIDETKEIIGGDVPIEVSKIEILNENSFRIYSFTSFIDTSGIELGQNVKIINPDNTDSCIGKIIKSPVSINVISGGLSWQRGQIFSFPASQKNTLAKVYKTSNEGVITDVEIIDFGHDHLNSSILYISPYEFIPITPRFLLETSDIGSGNSHYTITLDEIPVYINETLNGLFLGDYFLQDYDIDNTYNGNPVLRTTSETIPPEADEAPGPSIDIGTWQNSIATLDIEYGIVARLPGEWLSESSQLSNEITRLEDNYYYQLFSYVISCFTNPDEYRNSIASIHPAGLQQFVEYIVDKQINVEPLVSKSLFEFVLDLIDDELETSDEITQKYLQKSLNDNASAFSSDEIYASENWTLEDYFGLDAEKEIIKALEESISIESPDGLTSYEYEDYDSEEYDLEGYVRTAHIIRLGSEIPWSDFKTWDDTGIWNE